MASPSYTSRRQLEEHRFHPLIALLVPLFSIVLQAILPKAFPALTILELPLLITVFFGVSRRSPAAGALTGAAIGILQDSLTSQPIGVNGIAKTIIGYTAASIGLNVDVEALTTRVIMIFAFSLLNSGLLYIINRRLLGFFDFHLQWNHELTRAAINTAIAIPVFLLLDKTKRRD